MAPVRAELFSVERLEQHAMTLAAAPRLRNVPPLRRRLDDNSRVLLAAWRASAREVAAGREVVPAADWLLNNYHLVEAQIREIRTDLASGEQPGLASMTGFAKLPRQ